MKCGTLAAGNDLSNGADNPGGTSDEGPLLPFITSGCRHGGICSVCSVVLQAGRGRASLSSHTSVVFSMHSSASTHLSLAAFALRQIFAVNLRKEILTALCATGGS